MEPESALSGGKDVRFNSGEFIVLKACTRNTRFNALAKSPGDGLDLLLG